MKYITDDAEARRIDADIKNKWRNEWLQEEDRVKRKFSLWLKKTDEAGVAWCHLCSKRLVYKSNGKKVLIAHSSDHQHVERLAAASVLQTDLHSVYPENAGFNIRQYYHRVLHARSSERGLETPPPLPGIMWTRLNGKDLPAATWSPNHFVACLPSSEPDVAVEGYKRKSSGNLFDYFSKQPKPSK